MKKLMILSLLALQINIAKASWSVFQTGVNGKSREELRESLARVQELQEGRVQVATPGQESVVVDSKKITLNVEGYGLFTGTVVTEAHNNGSQAFKINSGLCWDLSPQATEFTTKEEAATMLTKVFNVSLLNRHMKKTLAPGEVYNVRNRPVIKIFDIIRAIE